MDRNQGAKRRAEPEGDWVVFHERPFPERLSRAFIIAGWIAAAVAGCAFFAAFFGQYQRAGDPPLPVLAGLSLIIGGVAFGLVYTVRCFAVAAYGLTRKKQYVLDWQPADPSIEHNRRAAWFFAALLCLCAFIYYLSHQA